MFQGALTGCGSQTPSDILMIMSVRTTVPEKEIHVHEVSIDSAQSDIAATFPNFKIDSIEPAGQGFTNIAFLVNGDYIFRFAKRSHASEQINREVKLLPALEPYVKLPIPHIEYAGKRKENSFSFMGYKKIRGETPEKDVFDGLHEETKDKFTKEIAGFISDVHTFPVEKAFSVGVELIEYKRKYQKEYEATQRLIYPLVDVTTRDYLKNLFEAYLHDEHNFTYTATFNHAEVSPYHVIVDRSAKKITGVIDFGDMHVGDPDWDFNYFYNRYGKEYITNLLKYYRHSEPERLMKKLDFFAKYGELQAIFVGIRENEEELKRGLSMLQKRVAANTV